MKYAAFLRGINVGGNVLIKMAELKKVLENAGFENVKTILASGNVVFEAKEKDAKKIARAIEVALHKKWKRDISVNIQSIETLKRFAAAQPFKSVKVTPQTRLYVTFLPEKPKNHLKLPSSSKDIRTLKTTDSAIFNSIEISPEHATLDLMTVLTKHYGPEITTRNWNTIQKVIKAAE